MPPLFAYKARVRRRGRIWEGFCASSCSQGGHPIMAERLKRGHCHKGLKPESSFLFFLFFFPFWHAFSFKTCASQLQTDLGGRQVPALPSALSQCFSSLCSPTSSTSSSSFSHQSARSSYHTLASFRYLERFERGKKSKETQSLPAVEAFTGHI